jgi:hypothetical protein
MPKNRQKNLLIHADWPIDHGKSSLATLFVVFFIQKLIGMSSLVLRHFKKKPEFFVLDKNRTRDIFHMNGKCLPPAISLTISPLSFSRIPTEVSLG